MDLHLSPADSFWVSKQCENGSEVPYQVVTLEDVVDVEGLEAVESCAFVGRCGVLPGVLPAAWPGSQG